MFAFLRIPLAPKVPSLLFVTSLVLMEILCLIQRYSKIILQLAPRKQEAYVKFWVIAPPRVADLISHATLLEKLRCRRFGEWRAPRQEMLTTAHPPQRIAGGEDAATTRYLLGTHVAAASFNEPGEHVVCNNWGLSGLRKGASRGVSAGQIQR